MKTYRTTKIICESRKGRKALTGRLADPRPLHPHPRPHGSKVKPGFDVNDQVNIKVEPGKLTLTKDS